MLAVNMSSDSFTTLGMVPVAVNFVHFKTHQLFFRAITDALKFDPTYLITNTTYYHLIAVLYDTDPIALELFKLGLIPPRP